MQEFNFSPVAKKDLKFNVKIQQPSFIFLGSSIGLRFSTSLLTVLNESFYGLQWIFLGSLMALLTFIIGSSHGSQQVFTVLKGSSLGRLTVLNGSSNTKWAILSTFPAEATLSSNLDAMITADTKQKTLSGGDSSVVCCSAYPKKMGCRIEV